MSQILLEVVCKGCGKLLGRYLMGSIEIKCPRCGRLERYEVNRAKD